MMNLQGAQRLIDGQGVMTLILGHPWKLLSCAALVAVFIVLAPTPAARAWDEPTLVVSLDSPVLAGYATDGTYIVWSTQSGGASNSGTVQAIHLPTGQELAVGSVRGGMAFDDGIVVWTFSPGYHNLPPEFFGTFAMDLGTGEKYVVSPSAGTSLRISDGIVLWGTEEQTENGPEHIYRFRRFDGTGDGTVVPKLDPALDQAYVSIEAGTVYWLERDPESGAIEHAVMWQIGSATPSIIEDITTPFTVENGKLFYVVDGLLYARDVDASAFDASVFDTGYNLPGPGATDGRFMFWPANPLTGDLHRIIGFDMETHSTFVAVEIEIADDDRTSHVGGAGIGGGLLVWGTWDTWSPDFGSELHAAPVADRLPSARRHDPSTTNPYWDYFPETGHYLGWGFRDYWEGSGGLPVFGYPLTEEFTETNADTGLNYTVQYFERQRFEWHPENHGTPYEVLLGRLGEELLEAQGRDWTTFETADPDAPYYFAETRHAIAPEFWGYWSTHGLEFGDPGISFRESLALFGYPLSEPATETNADGDTVLTQYFERAVFEYHPGNPEPYQVLLRRLGAEMLSDRGWLP